MADPKAVATQFAQFYYETMHKNRAALSNVYRDASTLTFEEQELRGVSAIMGKIQGLPQCRWEPASIDVQATVNGILASVMGKIYIDNDNNPQRFAQTFLLAPEGQSFVVLNDIFRFVNFG